jgi:DnaJ-class molecular chaperone
MLTYADVCAYSKGEDVVHQITCTLEDLYNGKTRKLAINRKVRVKKKKLQ